MTRARALLLSTALAAAFTLTSALPATAATHSPDNWEDLRDTIASADPGDRIVLGASITSTGDEGLALPAGGALELELNGHTLTITAPAANAAGIHVGSTASLTITATGGGTLDVTGGLNASGIGGSLGSPDAGNITITGGTILANGGEGGGGAGIGGAGYLEGGDGGTVTITGGTVIATGGGGGAGIGGGGGYFDGGNGGAVTITGGTVTATGGPVGGSGIGGGGSTLGIGGTGGSSVDIHGTATAGSHSTGGDGVGDPYGGLGSTLISTVTPDGVSYTATTAFGTVTEGSSVHIQFHYLVSFDTTGGSAVVDQTVDSGDTITEPAAPTRDGFQFTGWRVGDASGPVWNFTTPVTSPLTLVASWQPLLAATGPDITGALGAGVLLVLGGALVLRRSLRSSRSC